MTPNHLRYLVCFLAPVGTWAIINYPALGQAIGLTCVASLSLQCVIEIWRDK